MATESTTEGEGENPLPDKIGPPISSTKLPDRRDKKGAKAERKKTFNKTDRAIELQRQRLQNQNAELKNKMLSEEIAKQCHTNTALSIENWRARIDLGLRIGATVAILILVWVWLMKVISIVEKQQGAKEEAGKLSDTALVALLSTTTFTVIGLALTVARYLFPSRSQSNELLPLSEPKSPT